MSIKRHAGPFTALKDRKYWDTWRRNNLATTRAHDVAEVLNSDHHAVTTNDIGLFKEKQKFSRAIFDKVMQTDRRKKHVREYEED